MPAKHHIWNFEIAERLRLDATRTPEGEKRRLLSLARLCDMDADLVRGSRTAIADSRDALARANKLLGW